MSETLTLADLEDRDVSPGDAFALRATSDREGNPDSVLSGTVTEWDEPAAFDPADDDSWTAWFDPSILWMVDSDGDVLDHTSWLWARHNGTDNDSVADEPPGIQTSDGETLAFVIPDPVFDGSGVRYYAAQPRGVLVEFVSGALVDPAALVETADVPKAADGGGR